MPFNWNYGTQTQVSPSNAANLGIKWVFPVPESPAPYLGQGDEGVVTTPIVANGIAYLITNWNEILALKASTGALLWSQAVPIASMTSQNFGCGAKGPGCGIPTATHIHNGEWMYTSTIFGKALLWVDSPTYGLNAFDALTGTPFMNFTWFNPANNPPGNKGLYDPGSSNMMMIDEKRGIAVLGTENVDCQCEGRGFVAGWNILATPPTMLWQQFLLPPQDGSDPNWSINSVGNMTNAWIFNGTAGVNLKTLPAATLHTMLYNDWGNMGFNGTRSFDGLGVNWGGPWGLDPATGNVIVSTSEPSANNATFRPGPDLWAASILSVNDQTGKWNWGFQTTPHDLWDWDCSWGTIMVNVTIAGSQQLEVVKGCKSGIVYGLNAATGALNWYFIAPTLRYLNAGYKNPYTHGWPNPLNMSHMRTDNWVMYPLVSRVGGTLEHFSCANTGCIESDPAYDPVTGNVFVATYNSPCDGWIPNTGPGTPYEPDTHGNYCQAHTLPTNTTIWALNAVTGKGVWSFPLGNFGYRGGLTTSNGLVYIVSPTGSIEWLDAKTGAMVSTLFLGSPSTIQPAVATDSNGNTAVIIPASSITSISNGLPTRAGNVPGVVMALELNNPASGVTVTSTAPGVTVTSTAPGQGVTITSTAPGGAGATVTVTSTAPGGAGATVTVTSTSGGGSSTTLYGVAAVAVIFIIVSGFLAMRGRKPAP